MNVPSWISRCSASLPLLAALLMWAGGGAAVRAEVAKPAAPCGPIAHGGHSYIVCTFDLASSDVRLVWKDGSGEPYRTVDTAARSLTRTGFKVEMAMNAGMYHADSSPVGLYVEGGSQLKPASTAGGYGNFHMKPNGVFYVAGGLAGVLETGRYLKMRPKADYATQSGPMLVIDGRIHPRFQAVSTSLKIRNGVGVKGGRTVVFAISTDPVTFADFAHLYRDRLGCANALYLDGSISSLWAPSAGRSDSFWPAGPIVVAGPRK